ncbi:hypothetical protein I4U23_023084 [Adineta vaga]|nr:hypothetical protein I4U23_023084 [Adineta vaga]
MIKVRPILEQIMALSESMKQKAIGIVGNAGSDQWKFESENVQETMEAAKRDGEMSLSDDVKAFQLKQRCLWGSENIIYLADDMEAFKDHLYQFASMKGRWWPIVDKIYIYDPFKNLSSDTTLFDIPGYGDGYEAMTIRANETAVVCDQLVQVVRGDGRDALKPNFLKGLLPSSTSTKHLSIILTDTRMQTIKQKLRQKQAEHLYSTIDQYATKVQYHMDLFAQSREMSEIIYKRLWIGEDLQNVTKLNENKKIILHIETKMSGEATGVVIGKNGCEADTLNGNETLTVKVENTVRMGAPAITLG